MLGVSTLVAAYKGMCVVLHGTRHRHVRPWEPFATADGDVEEGPSSSAKGKSQRSLVDSYGSANCYEDEPWVVRHARRNVVRKVFDREVWIQEPALRQIQDTIFVQAMLAAVLVAGVLTAVWSSFRAGICFDVHMPSVD